MEEIKEATIISEKIIDKPMEIEPVAEITGTQEVTNNIKEVKEYAIQLKEYYSNKVVTEDTLNEYKTEKANVNKIKDKIADYRKTIIAEYKKPIEEFEKTAKEAELTLKETYEYINTQCNAFDENKRQEKVTEANRYFKEVCQSKNISFVIYENMNQNITLSKTLKSIYSEIDEYVTGIENDLNTIETMEDSKQILIEYMKDRNLSRSIKDVQERKTLLEKVENIEKPIQVVEVVEKEVLQAPIVEEEILECSFKVKAPRNKLKALVEYMNSEGIIYESIK